MGKKGQDVLFSENQFCSLSVWNFPQTFVSVSVEFWLRFEPEIRSERLEINCLFINARAEMKVHSCAKLFYFFRGWILICLTWNFSRVVPIQWRFLRGILGENYFGRICQRFCANQGYPLPKLVKFRPIFCNFILGPFYIENIHTTTLICW